MRAQPVVCPSCGWLGKRMYTPADELPGRGVRTGDGFGACRQCGAEVVRRPRAVQGFSDRKAAQARAEIAQWNR